MKLRLLALLLFCLLLFAACGSGAPAEQPDSTTLATTSRTTVGTLPATPDASDAPDAPASGDLTERPAVSVTIPEGFTTMQIAAALEAKGVCSKAGFVNAAEGYTVQSFSVPQSANRCFRYEGYLFPDTYAFYVDEDPVDVLKKLLNNYAARSGMPSDDALILASVIEKETRSSAHMRMVSSVLHNRLNSGMRLECDCTREYVNCYITDNPLVANPGKYAGLYNTYKCAARPAGPICNPGTRAIEAARNPAESPYFFYFFGNDNDNHYSVTYEEHQAQMKQYGVQYGH